MLKLRGFALTAIFLVVVAAAPVLAQGPLHKRVNFMINVPFELKRGETVLPPGNYVLFQINTNDHNCSRLSGGHDSLAYSDGEDNSNRL